MSSTMPHLGQGGSGDRLRGRYVLRVCGCVRVSPPNMVGRLFEQNKRTCWPWGPLRRRHACDRTLGHGPTLLELLALLLVRGLPVCLLAGMSTVCSRPAADTQLQVVRNLAARAAAHRMHTRARCVAVQDADEAVVRLRECVLAAGGDDPCLEACEVSLGLGQVQASDKVHAAGQHTRPVHATELMDANSTNSRSALYLPRAVARPA